MNNGVDTPPTAPAHALHSPRREPRSPLRSRLWPVLFVAGAAWWVVGALPWLLRGLTTGSARPDVVGDISSTGGLRTLLPLSGSLLPTLVTVTLVGGAVAALAGRWHSGPRPRRAAAACLAVLGSLCATAYAVAQSAGATRTHGSAFDSDDRMLLGLVAVAVAASVAGTVLGLLVSHGHPVVRALASAPLAVAAGFWSGSVVVATAALVERVGGDVDRVRAATDTLLSWAPVLVGALVGVALATVGLRPASRLVAWVSTLLLVAASSAALAALVHLTGQLRPEAGVPDGLRDLVDGARDAFLAALRPERQPLPTHLVALAGGLAGALALWRRTVPNAPAPADPSTRHTPSADATARDERTAATLPVA